MAFDPNLPQENTLVDAAQMRAQLNGLKAFIDAILTLTAAQVDATNTLPPGDAASVDLSVTGNTLHFTFHIPAGQSGPPGEVTFNDLNNAVANAVSGTSNNTNGVSTLNQSADSNYNQQQMQDVLNKLDEFLNAARRNP
ncbi:MAG: hypothetical protein JNG86_14135 [Verrucomicrobiaceae bacterium]|nr:hypothetical protein [Verrucomicrobiaceae bacterium]